MTIFFNAFLRRLDSQILVQKDTDWAIKLKDNGEITHEINLGAHPDFWNSIYSNSTFGSINNSETLVEIYEIDTTSGLSGVLLRDPDTLDVITTFETARLSGSSLHVSTRSQTRADDAATAQPVCPRAVA